MSIETFQKPSKGRTTTPVVSVRTDGQLTINAALRDALGKPTHLQFGLDRATNTMFLTPSDGSETNDYKVPDTGALSGGAFLRWAGATLPKEKTVRLDVQVVDGPRASIDLQPLAAPKTVADPTPGDAEIALDAAAGETPDPF